VKHADRTRFRGRDMKKTEFSKADEFTCRGMLQCQE